MLEYIHLSHLTGLLELFGAEAVHIWTAVLLKKRIFVYSPKLSELLSVVRAIPLIGAWHRQVRRHMTRQTDR